jgi:hypothetical protein
MKTAFSAGPSLGYRTTRNERVFTVGVSTSTVALRVVGGDENGSFETETNMVASPTGFGAENNYTEEGQQQL